MGAVVSLCCAIVLKRRTALALACFSGLVACSAAGETKDDEPGIYVFSSDGGLATSLTATGTDSGASFAPAVHALFPQVPKNGYASLTPLRLVSIVAAGDILASQLASFGDALVASQWYAGIATEYGLAPDASAVFVTGGPIHSGTPAVPAPYPDALVRAYIEQTVAANAGIAPDGHTLYLLYLPEGVALEYGTFINADCSAALGYHAGDAALSTLGDGYAVVQRCAATPTAEEPLIDELTRIASHEAAEAATDPDPTTGNGYELLLVQGNPAWQGNPWLEAEGASSAEIGDLCELTRVHEAGFAFQRILSNRAAAAGGDPCAPALEVPYYSVTDRYGWYAAKAGQSVTIALAGWSNAPTSDWLLDAQDDARSGGPVQQMTTHLLSGTTATVAGTTYAAMNNGREATLVVDVLPDTPSGAWGTVLLASYRLDATGLTPPGDDFEHEWVLGIYVP